MAPSESCKPRLVRSADGTSGHWACQKLDSAEISIMNRLINQFRTLLFLLLLAIQPLTVVGTPDTRLVRVDGVTKSMSEYIGQGQWVIVNVWSPSCTACVVELPQIRQFRTRNPGIPVIGVTVDFPSFEYGKIEVIKSFLERNPLDYPIFLADIDSASDVIGNRLVGIPLIAIFHPNGDVVARWPGTIDVREIEDFIANYDDYLLGDELFEDF